MIECYFKWCIHHWCNQDPNQGPFCNNDPEDEGCTATKEQIIEFTELRKQELKNNAN